MNKNWIPTAKIADFIGIESFAWLLAFSFLAYFIYRLFLRGITPKRRAQMNERFRVLSLYLLGSLALALLYWGMSELKDVHFPWSRIGAYFALFALTVVAIAVVRLAQAYVYIYLFLANMRTGVPRLIANVFTLVFSSLVFGWLASEVFGIAIGPILATSAVFSVVFGLALQDTLGNFFSGVALQMDRSFGIGDWIEVQHGDQKWMGQVLEVTWRATALVGFSDEIMSLPNKTLAQSQVTLFAQFGKYPRRNQLFRFPLSTSIPAAKGAVFKGLSETRFILPDPPTKVLVIDTTDSWIVLKCFYTIENFGDQYSIADQLLTNVIRAVSESGLQLATPAVAISPWPGEPLTR